jgi:hypothetical protein
VSSVFALLQKVLVRKFFRDNTSFFLLVIVLCFGFLSGREHRALAEGFIGSYLTMMIPLTLWILYCLKVVRYNFQQSLRQENLILTQSAILQWNIRYPVFAGVSVIQLSPAIAYAGFVAAIALANKRFEIAALILVVWFVLVIATAAMTILFVSCATAEKKTFVMQDFLNRTFTRPQVWVQLEHMLRSDPFMVLSSKLFSCILISAVAALYQYDEYDWRLLALGALFAFSGNITVMNGLHRNINHSLLWMRNMPIGLTRWFLTTFIIICLLSLPEAITIFTKLPAALQVTDAIAVVFLGISCQAFNYSILYLQVSYKDRIQYAAIIAILLAILFKVPLWLLTTANTATALLLFAKNFHRFEYSETSEEQSH